ncbi:MAG: anthranilate phosphoribosyltransferase [Vallitaleaceae bacterium]|nr:anthranilate phosphoribosyltransferase [Vallitaleaceae bacterium]
MITEAIEKVMAGNDLSSEEMIDTMNAIMAGGISEAQIAAFLTALKIKGEAVSEIYGAAKVMREKAEPIDVSDLYTIDTCGTGGGSAKTYNISTAVSIIAAAAGISVAKHGNRSITSKCGAGDVLEELGIRIDLIPAQVESCIREVGIGFMFAPTFHKAMRFVGPTRKALGFRTVFNILGPLANPANANAQVMGVSVPAFAKAMAEVLLKLGVERALVVSGADGLDEISIASETNIAEIKNGKIITYTISPKDFGMDFADLSELVGGYADENARILLDVLGGHKGPKRDILLLNAGAALYIGKKAKTLQEGVIMASEIIDSGKALEKLEELKAYVQSI